MSWGFMNATNREQQLFSYGSLSGSQDFYFVTRTHLSLDKNAPVSRAVDRAGHILCRSILGGLHHQYVRI